MVCPRLLPFLIVLVRLRVPWREARLSGNSLMGSGTSGTKYVNILTTSPAGLVSTSRTVSTTHQRWDSPMSCGLARGHLCKSRRLASGGTRPTTQPPPVSLLSSNPPGSCLNTLKQSKSNYHEQAAWEHLLHASLGIANVPALSIDRRWAP